MVFVAVDNDENRLRGTSYMLFKTYPGSIVHEFTDPMLSVKYICNHAVDVVYAKEKMHPVNGKVLTEVLHKQKPELSVILL